MQTLKTKQQLSIFVGEQQSTLGFVPTMGALHDGHMSLIRYAKDQCAKVIVSIFVNPLQFNEQNDFENYPETLDQDLLKLGDAEVDAVY
ncbi:MAG: pantoate--beta-alanine ligase, partial [Planctomycetota bacterium]|nr:pantoate--beta-alanine ligase [Planctomycetota bacterium]